MVMMRQNYCLNRTPKKLIQRRLNPRGPSGGQAFFKWLAILALLAATAASYAFLSAKRSQDAELARLGAENQQELAKQNEEVERLRTENKELERLRAESQEVVKLRGEVAQLRTLQKEEQKIQAENQQLRATIQQLQQVGTENSTLRNQNQQLQGTITERTSAATCLANLKAIEAVKARWAADYQKHPTEGPLDADLFGPGRYVPQKPVCPSGGVYTLGQVQAKPTCTTPGHTY